MKSRKWLVTVIVLFLLFIVGIQLAWKFLSVNDRLRNLLLNEIRPNIQGEVHIGKLEVKLGTIHLKNISIAWEKQPYVVTIRDLRLGLNFFNLIKYNFNPLRFISDVVVDQPKFILKNSPSAQNSPEQVSAHPDSLTQALIKNTYRQRLIDFKFVGRIVLDHGAVGIQDSLGKTHLFITQLDGWVNTEDLSSAIVRMNGKFLNSKHFNLGVGGLINLRRGALDSVRLNLYSDSLSGAFLNLPKEKMHIVSGTLAGKLVLREDLKSSGNPLNLSGYVKFAKLNIDFWGGKIPVRNLNYTLSLDHWNVFIQQASQNIFGTPVSITGKVQNLLNPRFNLSITSQTFVLRRIFDQIFPGKRALPRGRANCVLTIVGSPVNPEVSGTLTGSALRYGNLPVRRTTVPFLYKGRRLTFKAVHAQLEKVRVGASGFLSFQKSLRGSIQYRASGNVMPLLRSVPLRALDSLGLQLSGLTRIDSGRVVDQMRFQLKGKTAFGDTLQFSGSSTLRNKIFTIDWAQLNAPFQGQAILDWTGPKPQLKTELLHFGGSLWKIAPLPFQKMLSRRVGVSVHVEGNPQQRITYTLVAERRATKALIPNLFQVDGDFYKLPQKKMMLEGAIQYFPLSGETVQGEVQMRIGADSVILQKYSLGRYYKMQGAINRKTGGLKGQIRIQNAALPYVFDGLLLQPILKAQGILNGLVILRGKLNNPTVVGQLNLEKGIFSGYGYYNGLVSLKYQSQKLWINQLVLNREHEQILALTGQTDFSTKQLDFQAHGQNVDIDFLSQLLGNRIHFLSGRCSFDLSILDNWHSPDFRGHLEFEDGRLFFVNYDHLSVELGKKRGLLKDVAQVPGVWVQKMKLVRNGQFSVNARAFFPLSVNHEMDIRLQGEGNFFDVLLENVAFFKKTNSHSRFSFSIGGTYSAPIYTGGQVDFTQGSLEFQDVLPKATHLSGHVRLEPANQFVHIVQITGKMAGQPIELRTFGPNVHAARPLEPLVIHSWGLNFGVVGIKAGGKGIPVHIPGMMQPKDQIWVKATGKNQEDYLYLAGPSSSPVLRGLVYVHDGNISYPFEEEKKSKKTSPNPKPDFVTDVLNRMVWDLTVVPDRNVHYVKNIRGLIDNVWINATIDSPEDGLHFSGRLIDKSFRIVGKLESTRGSVEYLDLNFSIERFGIEFDRSDILPIVYGRARTVLTDSTGFPYNIYATLYTIDPQTKVERERGRWGQIHFRLSTDNPNIGNSEAQILGALGYSVQNIRSKAADMIGISADHLLIKPLFRPIERNAEKYLKLDIVSIRSQFARNMLEINRYNRQIDPRYLIFRSTQVTLGKYLKNNLFLLYSVELEAGLDPRYQESGLGFKNYVNLEYRMKPNLLFELQYNYNNLLRRQKSDFRVQIRHSFTF